MYGITQNELADRLGITRVSVSRLLSDNNDMRASTLQKIAGAIGCQVGEFFTGSPGNEEKSSPTLTCPHCGKEIKITLE